MNTVKEFVPNSSFKFVPRYDTGIIFSFQYHHVRCVINEGSNEGRCTGNLRGTHTSHHFPTNFQRTFDLPRKQRNKEGNNYVLSVTQLYNMVGGIESTWKAPDPYVAYDQQR